MTPVRRCGAISNRRYAADAPREGVHTIADKYNGEIALLWRDRTLCGVVGLAGGPLREALRPYARRGRHPPTLTAIGQCLRLGHQVRDEIADLGRRVAHLARSHALELLPVTNFTAVSIVAAALVSPTCSSSI